MSTKNQECLELLRSSLDMLQSPKSSASSIVRKLELVAQLTSNKELGLWCELQLGKLSPYFTAYNTKEQKPYDQHLKEQVVIVKERKLQSIWREIVSRMPEAGGGFASIEDIEQYLDNLFKTKRNSDGTRYKYNLMETISNCKNQAATRAGEMYAAFAFGNIPQQHLDVIRDRVDDLLLEVCPEAIEKFMSAYNSLASKSSEDWSLALTACRRIIKAVADVLYPPTAEHVNGKQLGEEQYINRLWAFLDQYATAGSEKDLAKAHVDYLGTFIKRLNEKACKGVHANVRHDEAVRAVLYTYLTLGDILDFAPNQTREQLKRNNFLDVNSATLEELRTVDGITSQIAKDIIKRRSKNKFQSIQELSELEGIGPKILAKLSKHLVCLTRDQA